MRPFRTPLFPVVPILGALMCLVLLMSLMATPATRNFFLIYLVGRHRDLLRLRHPQLEAGPRHHRHRRRGRAARAAAHGRPTAERRAPGPARSRRRPMLPDPRGPAGAEGGARRSGPPPCWSPRRARARPRSCRWSCWPSPGSAGGKIIVLEPRRLAARAAAERMATTLGEPVGRDGRLPRAHAVARSPPRTRIEVVTEGVFTRMILGDPGARRRRLRDLRRVPRAQPRRRPRPGAGPRRAGRAARGPAPAGDVGDPRRRGGGAACWTRRR